ncbi:uncharacterized protein LOC124153275 [Ischnura elegans]|uniref:uncharacterized protein LOC124153275 n=1 Tax=Ischnura elegans TaxID=197161 RepID=UPI001ED87D8A|nr:uncharacterized protein LOC124153275 [Ischnura elegans]
MTRPHIFLLSLLQLGWGVRMGDDPAPKAFPEADGGGGSPLLRGIMTDCVVGSAVSLLTGYAPAAPFGACLRTRVAESVARSDAGAVFVSPSLSAEVDPRAADAGRGRTIASLLSTSTLLDAANAFFETRAFRWRLDGLHPGLMLRLSPSISRGDGQLPATLEFLMEERQQTNDRSHNTARLHPIHETGRLLLKKAILPLLLGLKLKVTTIFPILFALTALLASKALFVAKFALLASGVVGLGVILFPGALASLGGLLGPHAYGPHLFNRPYGFNSVNPAYNPLLQYSAPIGGYQEDQGKGVLHHLLYDVHEGDDSAHSPSSSSASSLLPSGGGGLSSGGMMSGGLTGHRDVVLPAFGGGRRNFAWEDERKRE